MDDEDEPSRICVNCRFRVKSYHREANFCRRRRRFSRVSGWRTETRACERERSRLWRWFGFDTCGPEGRYWQAIESEGQGRPN